MQTRFVVPALIALVLFVAALSNNSVSLPSLQAAVEQSSNDNAISQQYGDTIYYQEDFFPKENELVMYSLTCPKDYYVLSGHCFSQNRVPTVMSSTRTTEQSYTCDFDLRNTGGYQIVTVSLTCKKNAQPVIQTETHALVKGYTTAYAVCPDGYWATGGACEFVSSEGQNLYLGSKLDEEYFGCTVNFGSAEDIKVTALCQKSDGLTQGIGEKDQQNFCLDVYGYAVGGECAPRTKPIPSVAGTLVDIRRGFWCFTGPYSSENLEITYVCMQE